MAHLAFYFFYFPLKLIVFPRELFHLRIHFIPNTLLLLRFEFNAKLEGATLAISGVIGGDSWTIRIILGPSFKFLNLPYLQIKILKLLFRLHLNLVILCQHQLQPILRRLQITPHSFSGRILNTVLLNYSNLRQLNPLLRRAWTLLRVPDFYETVWAVLNGFFRRAMRHL